MVCGVGIAAGDAGENAGGTTCWAGCSAVCVLAGTAMGLAFWDEKVALCAAKWYAGLAGDAVAKVCGDNEEDEVNLAKLVIAGRVLTGEAS